METVPLGQTGTKVSAVCLGTMQFGSQTDETTSFQLLDQYVAAGGAFLDTANIYAGWLPGFHGGESESLLGRWLKARDNRDGLCIATKVGGVLHHGHDHLPRCTTHGGLLRSGRRTGSFGRRHVDHAPLVLDEPDRA